MSSTKEKSVYIRTTIYPDQVEAIQDILRDINRKRLELNIRDEHGQFISQAQLNRDLLDEGIRTGTLRKLMEEKYLLES